MKILGISAFFHDAAASILIDGEIIAAAQEERFTRKKHDPAYPSNAIEFCLKYAGIKPSDLDYVAFYEKPYLKFNRLIETYASFAPQGFTSFRESIPEWLSDKFFQRESIIGELKKIGKGIVWSDKLVFYEHHYSHAASAFLPSPFERAAILTMDGVGEWATTSLALGNGNEISMLREIHFPHSLGLLYSAFTYYLGFKVNSAEYKVMGLAPYGTPRFVDIIKKNLIDIKEDGTFRLNLYYFDYCTGLKMTNEHFGALFGKNRRLPEGNLTQHDMDIAASLQAVTEEVVLKLSRSIARETGERNLCLAGGVALNCVSNSKILKENIYEGIWIQPAAGDAGGALGAALLAHHCHKGSPRKILAGDSMKGTYLGPKFSQTEIEESLNRLEAKFLIFSDEELVIYCANALKEGKAIGWFQGRMEFGPRSLGARSILADSRSQDMQKLLNLKVKYRESFRPFAPSVLREDLGDWFDIDKDSPYMLFVADVKEEHRIQLTEEEEGTVGIEKLNIQRTLIPAITHVDYSARIHTVNNETNPLYHSLISKFKMLTGCPVIVNTSFNVRGEPIVNSPEDAFHCFMGTGIELLVIGNCILKKEEQSTKKTLNYENIFEPD